MLALEQSLLTIAETSTVTLFGNSYKVKNIIYASDGSALKAHLYLINDKIPNVCLSIDITTKAFDEVDLSIFNI
jgi:hypothetical protein